MAKRLSTRSRTGPQPFRGVAEEKSKKSGKPTRLVRYPNTSNALRALLDETSLHEVSATVEARGGSALEPAPRVVPRPSPSERSKPSVDALRLILDALPSTASRPAGMSRPRAQFMPRIEPAEVFDGETLGRVVRIRRQMLDLSQQQLADLAGVGRRFVGELEAGKPTVELRKTLQACHALGLKLTLQVSDGR